MRVSLRELCAIALRVCRLTTTDSSLDTDAPCATCSDTCDLDDNDRELQHAEADEGERIDEVTHDNLLPEVT